MQREVLKVNNWGDDVREWNNPKRLKTYYDASVIPLYKTFSSSVC